MKQTYAILKQAFVDKFTQYAYWTETTNKHKTEEDAIACCLLGIFGELHEAVKSEDLDKEVGDILWYIGHLLYRYKDYGAVETVTENAMTTYFSDANRLAGNSMESIDFIDCFYNVALLQESMKKVIRDNHYALDGTMKQRVFENIENVLVDILWLMTSYGMDFLDILEKNQEKLNSRLERGVIGGSGDHR